MKAPVVAAVVANNGSPVVVGETAQDDPSKVFVKSVFAQMTDIEKAQHAARIKAKKATA